MRSGNDMRTAEAVFIHGRTALLSRTRNRFSHYVLRSGLRSRQPRPQRAEHLASDENYLQMRC
jgi:hypothetical protein